MRSRPWPATAVRPLEPEIHKARLVRMESESIPAKTFAQRGECPLGGEVILECHHGVVRVSHQDAPPLEAWARHCLEPFVQHVVQVNVRKQWGDHAALGGEVRADKSGNGFLHRL